MGVRGRDTRDGCVGGPYPRPSSLRAPLYCVAYTLVRVGMHLGLLDGTFSNLSSQKVSHFLNSSTQRLALFFFLIFVKALYKVVFFLIFFFFGFY